MPSLWTSNYQWNFLFLLCAVVSLQPSVTVRMNHTSWAVEQWMNEAVSQLFELVLCLLFWASELTPLSCETLLISPAWRGLFPLSHTNQGKKATAEGFVHNSCLCFMYSLSPDATFSHSVPALTSLNQTLESYSSESEPLTTNLLFDFKVSEAQRPSTRENTHK